MKVLLVNKFHYLKGGAEKYYFNLADALISEGDEVSFFSMKDKLNFPCEDEKYFVSHASTSGNLIEKLKLIFNMRYSKEAYKKMSKLLKDKNPEVVIINNFHKHLTFSIVKAIKDFNPKLPIVWVAHDLIGVCPVYTMLDGKGNNCEKCLGGNYKNCTINKCARGSKLLSYLARKEAEYIKKNKFYDLIDLIICPSKFLANTLIRGGFDSKKIKAILNPLEINHKFSKKTQNENYLLYFGRLSKEKGVESLIRAVKNSGIKLVVAGNGPIQNELKNIVKNENINEVEFVGYKSGKELDELVDNCKYVSVPSVCKENCPYSVTESLAKGKPVIARATGGITELVVDNENGFLFSDDNELKGAIAKAFALDEKEYLRLCENAIDFAKNNFDAKKYTKELKTIINEYTK